VSAAEDRLLADVDRVIDTLDSGGPTVVRCSVCGNHYAPARMTVISVVGRTRYACQDVSACESRRARKDRERAEARTWRRSR
jgi:hypothetical protein